MTNSLVFTLAMLGITGSCSETAPDLGGLMVVIHSDGPMAIDQLDLEVMSEGEVLKKTSYRVPQEAQLPTTLAIASNGHATATVELSVTGWGDGVPLDQRAAVVTQIPVDRVATLDVVLSARCSEKVRVEGNEAVSSCGEGKTCDPTTGDCKSSVVDASKLPTYEPGEEDISGSAGMGSVDVGESGAPMGGGGGSGGQVQEGGRAGSGAPQGGAVNTGGVSNAGGAGAGGGASGTSAGGSGGAGPGGAGSGGAGGAGNPTCVANPIGAKSTWTASAMPDASAINCATPEDTDPYCAPPARGIDGISNSRYSSNATRLGTEWYQIDFGKSVTVTKVVLNTAAGSSDYTLSYEVKMAATEAGLAAAPVITMGPGMMGATTITFPAAQTGQFLRIYQKTAMAGWWSLAEVDVTCQ